MYEDKENQDEEDESEMFVYSTCLFYRTVNLNLMSLDGILDMLPFIGSQEHGYIVLFQDKYFWKLSSVNVFFVCSCVVEIFLSDPCRWIDLQS
jgi:hypothetical protein